MSGFYTIHHASNQAYGHESAPRAMMPNPQDPQYIQSQHQQQHQQQREQQQQYQQDQQQPPMKPASQHLNNPAHQGNPEARRERPLVQRYDNRQDYMTDGEMRKGLSEYIVYRFEKALDGNETDGEGRPVRPTWRNVDVTEVENMSKQEAVERVQKLNSEGKSASEKEHALFQPQRRHIKTALKGLERTESDRRYCYILAQLDIKYEKLSDEEYLRDERNWANLSDKDRERAKEYYRGKDKAGKKGAVPRPANGGAFSKDQKKDGQKKDGKVRKETASITAFFRRQPSQNADVALMYREKKKGAPSRNAMQARLPNSPLQTTSQKQHQGASPVYSQDHQTGQYAQQPQQYYQQAQQLPPQYPPQLPQQYPPQTQKLPQQTQQAQQLPPQYPPQSPQQTQQAQHHPQQHSPQYAQQTQQQPQQYSRQAQAFTQQPQQAQNPQKAHQAQQHAPQQTAIPHRPKTPQERSAQPPVPPLVHRDQSSNPVVIHQPSNPKPRYGLAGDIEVVHASPASNNRKGDRSGERRYPTPSNRSSNSSLSDGVFSSVTSPTSQSSTPVSDSWSDNRGRAKSNQGRSRGRGRSKSADFSRSRSRSRDRNGSRRHSRPRETPTPALVEAFILGKEAGKKEVINELADVSQAALPPQSVDPRRVVPQARQRDSWSDGEIPARAAIPEDRADERREKFINLPRVVPPTSQMHPEYYARTPARASVVDDRDYVSHEREYRRDPAAQTFDRQNHAASDGRPAVARPIDRPEYRRAADGRLSDDQEYTYARGPRAPAVRYVDARQYHRTADDRLSDDQEYTREREPRAAAARPIDGRQYPRAVDDRLPGDQEYYTHSPGSRGVENRREYDAQDASRRSQSAGNTNFTSGDPRRRMQYVESASDSEDERPRAQNPCKPTGGQRDVYVRR